MRHLIEHAQDWLGRGWLPFAVALLALLLVTPSFGVGPMCDDYVQLARLDPRAHVPGFAHAPFNLFSFASGQAAQRAEVMEMGSFAWWTAPDFRLSFWRPLSSLTHLLDYTLRPRSGALAHAQSMLWFAALLAVLGALYRRFHVPWVAHLALLLYAVDDARGLVVSWPANRNALVAATFAFAALLAHDRSRREGWRPGLWLAPALFAAALLGGESALAVTPYLFAHALFVDQGALARRLAGLWPYAALCAVWLAVYKALGHGTSGGGVYANPTDEPVRYLSAVVERLPVLLAAQLGGLPSDLWVFLPCASRIVIYGLALATFAAFAFVLARVWRKDPLCRFWTVGAVLSLLPMCAAFPMDRLLVFTGVGAMAAIAMLLADAVQRDAPSDDWRWARLTRGIVLALLVLVHLVVAPVLLPVRVLVLGLASDALDRVDASIPRDSDVAGKTLVIVNAPVDGAVAYVPIQRAVLGVPRPRALRLLSTGVAEVQVSRLDATTLRVRPAGGFLKSEGERMMRGLSPAFHAGDVVQLSGVRVLVSEASADGRPAQADFCFAVRLDDPSLVWMQWRGRALEAYSPPAVGESHVLPALDGAAE